jgi:hypothetical protein
MSSPMPMYQCRLNPIKALGPVPVMVGAVRHQEWAGGVAGVAVVVDLDSAGNGELGGSYRGLF